MAVEEAPIYVLTLNTRNVTLGLDVDHGRIVGVDEGSIAEKAGMAPGWTITAINGETTLPNELLTRVAQIKNASSYPLTMRFTVKKPDMQMIIPPTPSPTNSDKQRYPKQQIISPVTQPSNSTSRPSDPPTQQQQQQVQNPLSGSSQPLSGSSQPQKPTVTFLPKMPFFEPSHDSAAYALLQQSIKNYPTSDSCPWEAEFPADASFCENLRLQHLLTPEANISPFYEIEAPPSDSIKYWNINKIWFSGFKEAWFNAHPHEITVRGSPSSHLFRASDGFWSAANEAFSGYKSPEMIITSSNDKTELQPSLQQWNDMVYKWNAENHCTERDRRKHVESRIAEAKLIRKYQEAEQRLGAQEEMVKTLLAKNRQQKEASTSSSKSSKKSTSCTNCKKLENEVDQLSQLIKGGNHEVSRLKSWEQRLLNKEDDLISQEISNPPIHIVGECPLPPAASRYRSMNSRFSQHGDTPIMAPHPVYGSRPVYSPSRKPQLAYDPSQRMSWHVTIERETAKSSLAGFDSRSSRHGSEHFNFEECFDEI